MAYTKLIYHIVFRPKNSAPVINEVHERDLYMYILGICRNHQCVHDIKIATGNFMRSRRELFPIFDGWESSYGAFTYSEADKDRVVDYIKTQKEHHRHVSTREEMRDILKEFGIEYDERYI